jgi:shikimate dehydrogenase
VTTLAAVIGSPVAHSLSPAIHNAAFAATGLDWSYRAEEVPAGEAGRVLERMRAGAYGGLSVTMPHKDDVARLVDEPSADVIALGAANCVVVGADGRLRGETTDGPGFVRSLHDAGVDPTGARCCVLGAGGAARAVVLALARAGAAEVVVVNRTRAKAGRAAELAGGAGAVAAGPPPTVEILVNATSIGMGADGASPVDASVLRPGLVVADLVYHPRRTALLAAAEAAGATAVDGTGMLVHQAALAFELWTGVAAPVATMRAAALAELGERDAGAPSADPD